MTRRQKSSSFQLSEIAENIKEAAACFMTLAISADTQFALVLQPSPTLIRRGLTLLTTSPAIVSALQAEDAPKVC
ncbi:hypothetical protein WG66_004048 [Moniliophthora roreri]|nr:hypothetical protein WG66_004048 [Moniliophthora roreri]